MSSYDVVVVGGGVVGASVAYHLARDGVRTLLVDRGDPGRATDAGAGILPAPGDADDPDAVARFQALAALYYPELIERLAADDAGATGYAVCGALSVALDDAEAAHLERVRRALARRGAAGSHEFRIVAAAEARELFPPLGDVRGGLFSAGAARVDGRRLAAALRRAGERHGLAIRAGDVEALREEGDAVRGVVVAGETVPAGHVVLAAGAWSGVLGERLGVRIPVGPMRGQIAHLELPGADTAAWPIASGLASEHYLVAWPDGRVVAGATRETGAGFEARSSAEGVMEVLGEALRVAPGLGRASLREVRVGLRPASADGLPILGPVPEVDGLLLATGHGPIGLQLGPYSGRLVAEIVTRGAPGTDISALGIERFAGRPAP